MSGSWIEVSATDGSGKFKYKDNGCLVQEYILYIERF